MISRFEWKRWPGFRWRISGQNPETKISRDNRSSSPRSPLDVTGFAAATSPPTSETPNSVIKWLNKGLLLERTEPQFKAWLEHLEAAISENR